MVKIKWTNSRKGSITDANGSKLSIHIRKTFKGSLNYGVYLNDNKVPTFTELTIERCKEIVTEYLSGVK
tara:strand:+ start:11230 stop:11436 length:207 start_codon:yes stop_codon:yes gene_type:complete